MHIAYLTQYYPPEPAAPAARVSELAATWVRRGHRVTILTGFPNYPNGIVPEGYRGRWMMREGSDALQVVRTWMHTGPNKGRFHRSLLYASFALSSALTAPLRMGTPDVLIATSPPITAGVAGLLASAARGVPFVFEVRDLWPESIVAVGALPPDHLAIRALENMANALYRRADGIALLTDSFAEVLRARGVDDRKMAVLKNGVDLKRFRPVSRDTALRKRLGYGERFVAAYVGTHGLAHALGSVLDVAKRLRLRDDIRFLFVGDGSERATLERRASDEGLDNVKFLGNLPRDAMNEIYATADVCLVPLRRTELFTTVIPSKMFEIMAMERPIVLSVDGEARAILERSGGGIFAPPEDVDAMTKAITRLADDRPRATAMGIRGATFVRTEFDRDAIADRYLEFLRSVVLRSRAGPTSRPR